MTERDHWQDVTYKAEGRARPLGLADEGEIDTHVLEREDGTLEIVEPTGLTNVVFANHMSRTDGVLPVKELYERGHGKKYEWYGPETIPVKLVSDPQRDEVVAIEFSKPLPLETLEEIELIDHE